MIGGRLAGLRVERAGFEKNIGSRFFQPLADVLRRGCLRIGGGKVAVQNRDGIETVGIGDPAGAACGNSRQAPADVVTAAQFGLLGDEQAEESAADISEADDG
jgi:hypothetical protein